MFGTDEGICGRFGFVSTDGPDAIHPLGREPDDVGVSFTVWWVSVSVRGSEHSKRMTLTSVFGPEDVQRFAVKNGVRSVFMLA